MAIKLTAPMEEIARWETNSTKAELISPPDIKYLRFSHPMLRPYIVKNWESIKKLKTQDE